MTNPNTPNPFALIPAREAAAQLREASGLFACGPALGALLRKLDSLREEPIPQVVILAEFAERAEVDKVLALRN